MAEGKRQERRGCLWVLAPWTTWLALLVAVVAWGIQAGWGETNWITAAVTYAPPLLFLAFPVLGMAIAWFAHRPGALLVGLAAFGLALAGVARPAVHAHRGLTRTMDSVRVVTWNVHNRFDRLDVIRARLDELQPDVVCLQEAYDVAFNKAWPGAESRRFTELVTLSRLPILKAGPVRPEQPRSNLRVPLEVRVRTRRGELSVLNVHLFSYRPIPGSEFYSAAARRHAVRAIEFRERELGLVEEWLRRTDGPKVVAGDLNTPPRGRLYARLAAQLTDAFAASGNGFGWSFPRDLPLWRIDYVWLADGPEPLDCRTVAVPPSDHYPVAADLDLPRRTHSP